METQLERLQSEIEDLNSTQMVMSNNLKSLNETMLKLTYQMTGTDGQNGARGDIKEIRQELSEIQARNRRMDILAARFEDSTKAWGGEERREQIRRHEHDRRNEENL